MSIKTFIRSFNKLVRINGSIISASISALLAGSYLRNIYNGIMIWLVIFFTITFGFAINDYFDHEKDRLYPNKHVIAAGMLTRKQVGIIAVVLFCLSALFTFFLYPWQQTINIVLLIILLIYSWINNRFGIIANLMVAVCSALSILIAQNNWEVSVLSLSCISVLFFITGREIIKDIHDVKADASIGKSSLPIRIGGSGSFAIAILLTVLSLAVSVFTGIYFKVWSYLMIMVLAHVLYLVFVFRYNRVNDEKRYQHFSTYSKISFLLIVPALLVTIENI